MREPIPFVDEPPAAVAPSRFARLRRVWPVLRFILRYILPIAVAVTYFTFGLKHLAEHQHQINPDGVGYISVAQHYLAGRFADAVNAYWSPLFSWLLVPLMAMKIEPLRATKILNLLIGFWVLAGMWRVGRLSKVPQLALAMICAAAIPLIVQAAFDVITPDLLVAAVSVTYLATMASPHRPTRWTSAVRIGAAMGLAYLGKAYALPFVLAHFVIVRAIELIAGGASGFRKATLLASAGTLVTLAVIVGAWSAALSHKFGYILTGSTGRYNLMVDGPHSPGQLMHWAGFMPPPNDSAVSAWEDITPQVDRMPRWDPATKENRDFLTKKIGDNFNEVLEESQRYTPWCYPILLLALVPVLSRAELRPRRPGLLIAAALLLYPLGYLVLHIEPRFLTPLPVFMLLGVGQAIGMAHRRKLLSGWWRPAVAAGLIGLTFLDSPQKQMEHSIGAGEGQIKLNERFGPTLPPLTSFASEGDWSASLYLAFHNNLRYFGEPAPAWTPNEIAKQLQAMRVEYYFLWNRRRDWPAKAGWKKIESPAGLPFKIYRVPNTSTTQPATLPASRPVVQ